MSIQVSIDQDLLQRLPGFRLGFIEYEGIVVSELPKVAKGRMNLFTASLRLDYAEAGLAAIEGIKASRQAFKQLGIDPSKYRPSSEALIRRVLQEKTVFGVNGAVDVNNFLSMKFVLPYGIYNADKVEGGVIVCRLGKEGEAYDGLNGRETSMTGKLILADQQSPFGSPIVDSVRTSIDETTQHIIQVIFIHPDFPQEKEEELLETSASLFVQINGGKVINKGVR
ncbi:B3/4 domain-containing protein [Ammoniphilus sp. YIM 78166]|uniref:B3/B4 domain-containing protein n=1 Tax=Ammoniphilus sp. YIM 78166 TaxID=1644106 RepID=UPI001F0D4777|nr:phenylalanine--tRNA ligase beta subunit-related protein [Ammoniphilus sp. YIM 78166]